MSYHEKITNLKVGIGVSAGTVTASIPTIWKLIQAFQREESLIHAEIHQVLGGHPVPQQKKYAQCAVRVKHIVASYPARRTDMLGCARVIAHNISF